MTKDTDVIAAAVFTIVLQIKIVTKSLRGNCNKFCRYPDRTRFSLNSSLIFVRFKENNAISEQEKNAENKRSINRTISLNCQSVSKNLQYPRII